jgi:hypothetical protein
MDDCGVDDEDDDDLDGEGGGRDGERSPLSVKLAAYGESLALERRLREAENLLCTMLPINYMSNIYFLTHSHMLLLSFTLHLAVSIDTLRHVFFISHLVAFIEIQSISL